MATAAAALLLQLPATSAAARPAATVELWSTTYQMKLDPAKLVWSGRSQEVRRFRVESTAGLERGQFVVTSNSLLKTESVQARLRRDDGKWREATLDVRPTLLWKDYPGYDDNISQLYAIRGLRLGDVAEIDIRRRHLAAWEIPAEWFGGPDSIVQRLVEIRVPDALQMAADVSPGLLGWPVPQAGRSTENGEVVLRFEARNLPGLGDLPVDAGPPADLVPVLRVAAHRMARGSSDTLRVRQSWANFTCWYEGRLQPQLQLDASLRSWVARQQAEARDEHDLIGRLYGHVQRQIHYVAVVIGEGGWLPHAVVRTHELRYGDCKDMSALLVALLREAGLPAHLALVNARGAGRVNASFPYSMQFNHCIAYVAGTSGVYWLDATDATGRAGAISSFIDANPALILAGEACRFETPAPRDGAGPAVRERFAVALPTGDRAGVRFRIEWCGAIGGDWRARLWSADESARADQVAAWVGRSFAEVEAVRIESLRNAGGSVVVEGIGTVPAPWKPVSGGYVLPRGGADLPLPVVTAARRLPYLAPLVATLETEIEVALPGALQPDSAVVAYDEDFAQFRLRAIAAGDRVTTRRSLAWKQDVVVAAEIPRLADFLSRVGRENTAWMSVTSRSR